MAKQSSTRALTAGLILIGLGVIFLLENWYQPFSAWRMIARYWPLILILVGINKLYRHFSWHEEAPPVPGSNSQEQTRSH